MYKIKHCYICGKECANKKLRHEKCVNQYKSFHYYHPPMMYSVNTGKLLPINKQTTHRMCRVDVN